MRNLPKILASIFLVAISTTARSQVGKTVFYDATVIDVQSGKLLKHQEVIVTSKKILAVQPISKIKVHQGSQIIQANEFTPYEKSLGVVPYC